MVRLVSQRIELNAPVAEVFRHLTTVEGLLRWMAVDAIVELEPGGRLQWTHENGATMIGRMLELDPPRRLVFDLRLARRPDGRGARVHDRRNRTGRTRRTDHPDPGPSRHPDE